MRRREFLAIIAYAAAPARQSARTDVQCCAEIANVIEIYLNNAKTIVGVTGNRPRRPASLYHSQLLLSATAGEG